MFLKTCQGRNLNCNVTDGQRPNEELCDWSFIWNETRPVNTRFKDCASQECAKSISKCAEEDNAEARNCRWDADFCIVLKIFMQILYFYASFCKGLHLFAFIFKIMQILMQISAKFRIGKLYKISHNSTKFCRCKNHKKNFAQPWCKVICTGRFSFIWNETRLANTNFKNCAR